MGTKKFYCLPGASLRPRKWVGAATQINSEGLRTKGVIVL